MVFCELACELEVSVTIWVALWSLFDGQRLDRRDTCNCSLQALSMHLWGEVKSCLLPIV